MGEDDQFAFQAMLEEMETAERAMLDEVRGKAQAWWNDLTIKQKADFAELVVRNEWATHVALAAAAGDWIVRSRGRISEKVARP